MGVKDQGREGKRFIQHFLVCLLHKLNHRSMKVDVLNLKGNKRSGKLTTDEKKKAASRDSCISTLSSLLSA